MRGTFSACTGETVTGRLLMQYAAQNIIPSTTELGGKSPNIFFADVMDEDDEFLDKARSPSSTLRLRSSTPRCTDSVPASGRATRSVVRRSEIGAQPDVRSRGGAQA